MLDTERLCLGCMNDNGGEKICSICGYDSKEQNDAAFLPTRYWLKDRYLVGRVTENNGEGVTYVGWDNKEDAIVNIREYFPKGIAERNSDSTVKIVSGNEFTYNEGIMNFLELNRKLQKLDLPSLLPVVEVFELNGTAYSVTKTVASITLREFLIRNGGNLKWEQAKPLFMPLIITVAGLHEAGIIHRGISTQTILVGRDGKLRLTGICIRPVRMAKSNMTIQLFPGYAAVEQYGYDIENRDGKYTDVYGMAATIFRVLMSKDPMDVSERLNNDSMQIPARYAESIPKYVLTALANALQIMPENRTQDMDNLRISLTPVGEFTTTAIPVKNVKPVKTTPVKTASISKKIDEKSDKSNSKSSGKYIVVSCLITAAVFIIIGAIVFFALGGDLLKPSGEPVGSEASLSEESIPSENTNIIITPEDKDKLYQVPKLVGQKYSDVIENIDYNTVFTFEVVNKKFSDQYPRGYVLEQTPNTEQSVKKGTIIQLVLSLGPQKVAVPDVMGKDSDEAVLELLKKGFAYENIEILKDYSSNKKEDTVVSVEPGVNQKIDADTRIVLRVAAGVTTSSSTSNTSSSSSTSTASSSSSTNN